MQRTITIKIENLVGSIYIKMSKDETMEDVTAKVSKRILQGLQAAVQSVQVAEVKGKREETYESIYDMLEMRLNQLGDIQAKDAWHICRGKHSYSVITVAFKGIMHTMIEQGRESKERPLSHYCQQPEGKMICHYCKTNPGLKPGSDTVWHGFKDADMSIYVCHACKARHYMAKNKSEHRFLYSEFPVVIPPAQLTLKLRS